MAGQNHVRKKSKSWLAEAVYYFSFGLLIVFLTIWCIREDSPWHITAFGVASSAACFAATLAALYGAWRFRDDKEEERTQP